MSVDTEEVAVGPALFNIGIFDVLFGFHLVMVCICFCIG